MINHEYEYKFEIPLLSRHYEEFEIELGFDATLLILIKTININCYHRREFISQENHAKNGCNRTP